MTKISNHFPFAVVVTFHDDDVHGKLTLKAGDSTELLNEPDEFWFEVPKHVDLSDATAHGKKVRSDD